MSVHFVYFVFIYIYIYIYIRIRVGLLYLYTSRSLILVHDRRHFPNKRSVMGLGCVVRGLDSVSWALNQCTGTGLCDLQGASRGIHGSSRGLPDDGTDDIYTYIYIYIFIHIDIYIFNSFDSPCTTFLNLPTW